MCVGCMPWTQRAQRLFMCDECVCDECVCDRVCRGVLGVCLCDACRSIERLCV